MFTDDILLFCRAKPRYVEIMFEAFLKFSKVFGLCANPHKSCVYLAGVNDDVCSTILGMNRGDFPFRYLGVTLHYKRLSAIDCRTLVDRITAKLQGWSTRFLTYAGRVELVRCVIGGIQSVWTHLFGIPKKVLKLVNNVVQVYLGW